MAGGMSKKKRMGYMGGGMMMGSMKKKPPMSKMFRGGGMTSDATPSYKDMVQKMYGGGMTKKKLNYKDGGKVGSNVPDKMEIPTEKDIETFKRMGVSQSQIDQMKKEGVLTVTTVGKRRKRPLDGERSRGRKYDRANARTKFVD